VALSIVFLCTSGTGEEGEWRGNGGPKNKNLFEFGSAWRGMDPPCNFVSLFITAREKWMCLEQKRRGAKIVLQI